MRTAIGLIIALTLLVSPAHAFSLKPSLLELGGGVFKPESEVFQRLYNDHYSPEDPRLSVPVARATMGWFIYRIVSLSLSGGYFYASGFGLVEPTDPELRKPLLRPTEESVSPAEESPSEGTPAPEEPASPQQATAPKRQSASLDWSKLVQNPELLESLKRTRDLYTLSVFPMQADFRLNLHVLRNQWVIPYAAAGGEYLLAHAARRQGKSDEYWFKKLGWHYGGGVMLLLDVLDRYHADKMEDEWGIADTYLSVSGEKRTSLANSGELAPTDFSGWTYAATLTFRLKSN